MDGITTELVGGFRPGEVLPRHASADASCVVGRDLREVLERLPLAAMLQACDEAGSVVLVNEPFVRTFGYTLEDMPTVHDWAVKAYPDLAYGREACTAWDAAVARARGNSGRVEGLECCVACKDGTVRDVVCSGSVIAQFLMVTFNDISRHKETERSLQAATERMRLAAAAAGFGFWTRDLDAEVEEWDDQMLDVYGVSRAAFDGRWEPFLHPDDRERACAEAQRAIDEGRRGDYVFRIVRPDGTIRHLRGLSQVLRDAHGRPTLDVGVDIDITRQVEAEATLAVARERERQREEARRNDLERKLRMSLSAAAAAHEIKQPLSRILLETQLTIERLQGQSPDAGDMWGYLETMLAESQHVVDMVTRMKALLRNAESKQGAVEVGGIVAIVVGDSGPGMPDDVIADLPLVTSKPDGTGLGLYLVRTCMENHGGAMTIGRSPLGGAEVRLSFPSPESRA